MGVWFLLLSALVAHAKAELTDVELKKIAEKELSASERMSPVLIQQESDVIVNTDAAIQKTIFSYAKSEIEFGAQSYAPVGTSKLVGTETYSLNQLQKKPMFVVGGRYWAWELSQYNLRFAPTASVGLTNHSLDVRTQSGRQYKDVRGTTILTSLGAESEWVFYRRFALGLHLALGKLFYIQSGTSSQISQSLDANYWEFGPMLRAYVYENIFTKISFQSRKILSTEDKLGVQNNSLIFSIGMGM